MNVSVDREAIVKKIAGQNEQALRMGLMFNQQTKESAVEPAETVDLKTESALGIMAASDLALAEDEESMLHLLDTLNWSKQQVGSFLQVLAEGS